MPAAHFHLFPKEGKRRSDHWLDSNLLKRMAKEDQRWLLTTRLWRVLFKLVNDEPS